MGTVGFKRLSLGGVLMALAVLASGNNVVKAGGLDEGSFIDTGAGNFYIGLSYNPAIGKVRDFAIKESTGETKGVFPYKGGKKKVELKAINFDWDSPDPRISFKDSKILAFDGSVGYGIGGGRVELEVGYEKFKTKGVKRGDADDEGIYLLAKDLAYNVALDQTNQLTEGIKQLTKKNMHDVSQAINRLDVPNTIDTKICGGDWVKESDMPTKGKETAEKCFNGNRTQNNKPVFTKLSDMFKVDTTNGNSYPGDATNKMGEHTSAKISKDVSNLNRDQKGVVSSAFAKAHEGAEIVEIRSISTTSVMVNACYDVLTDGLPVSPYGCAGIGANFVSVVDGHITPKLSYKLKGGFSYGVTPEISAFVGGYYMKVLGNDEYTDLPVEHMVDDQSAAGKTKDAATATFDFSYFGAELGVRFMF